jgi:hypothetical protein
MAHSESRRRHRRAYLRKIWYLKNFLALLKLYRSYLCWKHFKRLKNAAIKWHTRDAICWKEFTICWNRETFPPLIDNYKTVIYRFFGGQLTTTLKFIGGMPSLLLLYDELNVDKIFVIALTCETVWSFCLNAFLLAKLRCKIEIENLSSQN